MECRKSVRDLSAAEKTAYVNAVLALKTAPSIIPAAQTVVNAGGGTPNRYDDYVWMHNVIGFGAHRGSAFGPWHREFLRQFELDLRQVSGNPHISIPYWDWTVDRTPASPGWPFTDDFMGGFASDASFQITSGPFSNSTTWRINVRQDSSLTLKRNIGVPAPSPLPTRATVRPQLSNPSASGGLAIGIYDTTPYNDTSGPPTTAQINASWRKYLERRLHDTVHVWIGGATSNFSDGGHMTFPPVAVNDPIFFLHHCSVDRLWTIWQQVNPTLGYEPASGADAGHNAGDVMSQLSDPSHFNFPLANHPTDVLDWHARGIWFRSDLPAITPRAASVDFGDVPEDLTTFRPAQFDVRTCQRVKFKITAIGGANFSIPPGQGTVVVEHSEVHDPVTANVYVAFESVPGLSGPQAGTVHIEAYIDDADGYFEPNVNDEHLVGSWDFNLVATPVPRPAAAVVMVLDRSGSMADSAGPAGTKSDLLKASLQVTADVMHPTDGIGIVSYDDLVTTLSGITQMGAVSPPGAGRATVTNAIGSGDLDPRGSTAIGAGMIQGASVLDAERTNPATPYSRFGG